MRGLRREEELEDTVSHLSIYLTGLDQLYQEQAAQLKHQISRAEKAIQDMEAQQIRAIRAKNSLAALQAQWQNHEVPRTKEGEPEETHWDKGTQTEDEEHCLPPKKRRTWFEEASP